MLASELAGMQAMVISVLGGGAVAFNKIIDRLQG